MGHYSVVSPKMVALKYSMLSILVRALFQHSFWAFNDAFISLYYSRYDKYDKVGLRASCMLLGASPGSSSVLACDVSALDILSDLFDILN